MSQGPGQFYQWLRAAVAECGSQRSIYTPETTLTRRSLLTRADRRAKEFSSLGIGTGDVVAVSLGNSAECLVILIALSKLGAVGMPVDAANGDRVLRDALTRVVTRAVIRRPRGQDSAQIQYPRGYHVRSSRRLPGSMTSIDVLTGGPRKATAELPPDAEVVLAAVAGDSVTRDVVRTGAELRAIGAAAAHLMALDQDTQILCVEPITSPRFFDPVLLGWLASPARLAISDGDALEHALNLTRQSERVVVVNAVRGFLELARALSGRGETISIIPVIPEAAVPIRPSRVLKKCFGHVPLQLLQLEECGLIASRTMAKGESFVPATNVELLAGRELGSGREVLVRGPQFSLVLPQPPAGHPGTPVLEHEGWRHTGYVGQFTLERLGEVLGREDGLVNIEGRRACIETIRVRMLEHRRIISADPVLEHTSDGDPVLELRYVATGKTPVEDIQEHAIGGLPPYMVPRVFKRVSGEAPG